MRLSKIETYFLMIRGKGSSLSATNSDFFAKPTFKRVLVA